MSACPIFLNLHLQEVRDNTGPRIERVNTKRMCIWGTLSHRHKEGVLLDHQSVRDQQ